MADPLAPVLASGAFNNLADKTQGSLAQGLPGANWVAHLGSRFGSATLSMRRWWPGRFRLAKESGRGVEGP